ncbi:hypothetical protein N7G274_008432 [Stereocaulon virgatum]|uniref:Uncharacterized protein n=1 Tax=Stereocaulon virgatum TaxID=373712 RepID=A0ABR4A1N7_9LECA
MVYYVGVNFGPKYIDLGLAPNEDATPIYKWVKGTKEYRILLQEAPSINYRTNIVHQIIDTTLPPYSTEDRLPQLNRLFAKVLRKIHAECKLITELIEAIKTSLLCEKGNQIAVLGSARSFVMGNSDDKKYHKLLIEYTESALSFMIIQGGGRVVAHQYLPGEGLKGSILAGFWRDFRGPNPKSRAHKLLSAFIASATTATNGTILNTPGISSATANMSVRGFAPQATSLVPHELIKGFHLSTNYSEKELCSSLWACALDDLPHMGLKSAKVRSIPAARGALFATWELEKEHKKEVGQSLGKSIVTN